MVFAIPFLYKITEFARIMLYKLAEFARIRRILLDRIKRGGM